MALFIVKEIGEGEGSYDQGWHRSYTRTFLVIADSPLVSAEQVMLAPSIPRVYEPFITDTGRDLAALAREPKASRLDPENPALWRVVVNYSTRDQRDPSRENNSNSPSENPLNRPPDWRWEERKAKRVLTKTAEADPKPICNSAQTPYETQEIEVTHAVLVFTRTVARFDPSNADFYRDTVNLNPFQGYDARKARVAAYTAQHGQEKGIPFDTETIRIEFGDWDLVLEDAGPEYYTDPVTPNVGVTAANKKIIPVSTAGLTGGHVRLNGSGQRLADGAAPVYNTFKTYFAVDFSGLNIPDLT